MKTIPEDNLSRQSTLVAWAVLCLLLVTSSLALYWFGNRFAWEQELASLPSLWLAAGLSFVALIFLLLVPLISHTPRTDAHPILGLMIVTGLVMRIVMVPAMPALEDDFYRYLWDGAVTANGYNPYSVAPNAAVSDTAPAAIQNLATDGALVLDRVNHSDLKTIYPPVAQAFFAAAYWLEPWSLRAWRLVCLAGEIATLALLFWLLRLVGRSPLWAALYWLNPLIVKELMNTAHMEAIVMPFVLGAIALVASRRPILASASLGLAIGAKLWPVMLLPLVLRPLVTQPWRLLAALAILGAMAIAWIVPPALGGLGSDSGFVAYASRWQTNSALFPTLQEAMRLVLSGLGLESSFAGTIVRLTTAGLVGLTAILLARNLNEDVSAIIGRAALIVGMLFFLSPAQFPWYASWVLVFAPFFPLASILGLTVFLPLYYVSFYFFAHPDIEAWYPWLVWIEWLPIWLLLAFDGWRYWTSPLTVDLTAEQ